MKRLLAIGIVLTLLLLNVGIAAAAGTAPDTGSTATTSPTLSQHIVNAIQTVITRVITPAPTPVPVSAKKVASPAAAAPAKTKTNPVLDAAVKEHKVMDMHKITNMQRKAAAELDAAQGLEVGIQAEPNLLLTSPAPGGIPDYFGANSNYALSQLPTIDPNTNTVVPGTGIRKFVDTLPGLNEAGANNLGQFIPIAVPDTTSYSAHDNVPAADYYEIAAVEWFEKMHSDIPPTTIRGYVQLETPVNRATSEHVALTYLDGSPILNVSGAQVYAYEQPHFLGPLIIAQKDKPVRIKFHNYLKVGGSLSIPTDTELMGSGLGPLGAAGGLYSQQRATIHLHGGNTPWISDGTQHQWTVPLGEKTSYPKGVSVAYVPDMDNGVEPVGTLTFYYTNQQSARLMFYHEHAMGSTRLGVMAGEAAAYIVQDPAEAALVAMGAIPANQIPLVIIDRTFVPDAAQMTAQDPTWNWGGNLTSPWPHTGDFYFPHVYMPAQDQNGNPTAMGRWDYGPWAGPPNTTPFIGPKDNPYSGPNAPWEPPLMPGVPTVSQVPETFLDTPVVNGVAYPTLTLGPYAYRFRILNAANERFLNLGLYKAVSNEAMWNQDGTLADANAGEVPTIVVPQEPYYPAGRVIADPAAAGPNWTQIGTEGGFLPAVAEISPQAIDWDTVHGTAVSTNIGNRGLLIGPAERSDVIVDFSQYAGQTLILYNDAPAPLPGPDDRYDFYTGDPDQTAIGGAPTTQPGYGPNTRTLMQIKISSSVPANGNTFNRAKLDTELPKAYAQTQDKPLVPQEAYNDAFNAAYSNQYLGIPSSTFTFIPADQNSPITMNLMPKSVMEGFDPDYGRITAQFGVEKLGPGGVDLGGIGYFNNDPYTELFNNSIQGTKIGTLGDGTQIWKITHNGVDTHIVHVHMYNLQVINRVYWDGTIVPPEENEVGWKESVQINSLQDLVVAMRPITPNVPWEIPNSIHPLSVVYALGTSNAQVPGQFTNLDPQGNQVNVVNHNVNFGWEYVWHCHLLGHEENDMMRSQSVAVAPKYAPKMINAQITGPKSSPSVNVIWKDTTVSETNWTIQRSSSANGPWTDIAIIPSATGPAKGENIKYNDKTVVSTGSYFYRVLATNIVGDTTVYPNSIGYPHLTVNSPPSEVSKKAA
jgi:FtsP/CotA-like multicopper oxidase with cupredoxin domain